MATSANPPPGATPTHGSGDPFTGSPSHAHPAPLRYAPFDSDQFLLYSTNSPSQAKRALEAHLKDTDRRIQDASKLGTTLLRQKKELAARLKEVEDVGQENEVPEQLKQRLADLEKEYNEVGKESARAFLPRSKAVNEALDPSKGSVLAGAARDSPSKVTASSRRQRNQASNRVHDIEFAAEISTSLLAQVRQLQAALAEKEQGIRDVVADKARLESEANSMSHRIKQLDESEQRYKDATWELETRLQDLEASHRDVADKEARTSSALMAVVSQKSAAQRELDELKLTHAKLNEDHSNLSKKQDADLHALRRDAAAFDVERTKMQKKIDEIVIQNQELAKAVASGWRSQSRQATDSEFITADEDGSPDVSAHDESDPASPVKGTPARHGMLESETLKSSLNHAHRMIQNLKNNIHREKTEKIELRRLLGEARDELENRRDGASAQSNVGKKRSSKDSEGIKFKKPERPSRLGAARNTSTEILEDEPDWEDDLDATTPSKSAFPGAGAFDHRPPYAREDTDTDTGFETAQETEGFETANERGGNATESDAFHTGAESLSGDSEGDLTETEGTVNRSGTIRGKSPLANARARERSSYMSTASISADEDEDIIRTPQQGQLPKYRLRVGRGARRSRGPSGFFESPQVTTSSPAVSSEVGEGTPLPQGQNLGDELDGMDVDSLEGTPGRSISSAGTTPLTQRYASVEPESASKVATSPIQDSVPSPATRPTMVDSGMMTEPWEPEQVIVEKEAPLKERAVEIVGGALAGVGLGSFLGHKSDNGRESPEGVGSETATPEPESDADEQSHSRNATAENWHDKERPTTMILDDTSEPEQHTEELTPASIVTQHTEPIVPEPSTPTRSVPSSAKKTEPMGLQLLTNAVIEPVPVTPERVQVSKAAEQTFALSSVMSQDVQPVELPASVPSTPLLPRRSSRRLDLLFQSEPSAQEAAKEERADNTPDASRPGSSFFASILPPVLRRQRSKSLPNRAGNEELVRGSTISTGVPVSEVGGGDNQEGQALEARHKYSASASSMLPVLRPLQIKKSVSSEGSQTVLAGSDIDKMLRDKSRPSTAVYAPAEAGSSSVRPGSSGRSTELPIDEAAPLRSMKRPTSSGSMRSRAGASPPPLPADHTEKIAAAAKTPAGTTTIMGPPAMPASAYKLKRTQTPSISGRPGTRDGTTPRAARQSTRSEVQSAMSGRSSISSFASEVDERIRPTHGVMYPDDIAPATDPRMIQAITQTMIGEFLWKYTRKAGRSETSNTRHRRFFWVHPYTRTLYWSEHDPSTAGRDMLKAKSVAIQSVRVITDDNAYPPGLHRKSLVVVTPGREIVFTAPTGQRHETWFNALSYLLLRTEQEKAEELDQMNDDELAEFNPGGFVGRSMSRMTGRSRSRTSLSSYNSRTTRTSSPHMASLAHRQTNASQRSRVTKPSSPRAGNSYTATTKHSQARRASTQGSMSGRLSSLAGAFRQTGSMRGSLSSRRGVTSALSQRTDNGNGDAIYDASVVGESAEDLRNVIERQERDADRLENVRACCDGKHDVGSLPRNSRHSSFGARLGRHSHSHAHAPTPRLSQSRSGE